MYRLQQCAYIVVDKLAQYLPSFVPRDATRDCVQFNEFFFQRQLDGSKYKEEPLTSLDKISENFVRRADGKLQSSNKEK